MPNNTTSMFLAFIVGMTSLGLCEDKPQVELRLSVFPENVAFGDTCYVTVTAINHSEEDVGVFAPGFRCIYGPNMVQFDLSRQGKTWRGTFECWDHKEVTLMYIDGYVIPIGESVTFLAVPLQFPPMEDLYQDKFWEEIRKEFKDYSEGLPFDFGIEFATPTPKFPPQRARLTQKITVKSRNDKETAMIDQWYHNTPSEFFPEIVEGKYISKVPPKGLRKVSGKKILDHSPWMFINTGNRYPSDPNIPETWQGWKELEESITPSTMRDEIRLTRILIQYCDTKDAKILEELKTWFAEMNKTQRICMARTVRGRAKNCYGDDSLLAPFRDLYQTILEYDIAAKSEREVEWMKQLKLLE